MTPPNVLTLSRLGLAALMMALMSMPGVPGAMTVALGLFIVGGVTDFLDGYLARTRYGVTAFGQLMDPLTDKVLVCAAFVAFIELGLVPAWMVLLIITREFLVTGLRLLGVNQGRVISAGPWGKHKTIWQITAIILILAGAALRQDLGWAIRKDLFRQGTFVIAFLATLITVVSGAVYLIQHRDLLQPEAPAAS